MSDTVTKQQILSRKRTMQVQVICQDNFIRSDSCTGRTFREKIAIRNVAAIQPTIVDCLATSVPTFGMLRPGN